MFSFLMKIGLLLNPPTLYVIFCYLFQPFPNLQVNPLVSCSVVTVNPSQGWDFSLVHKIAQDPGVETDCCLNKNKAAVKDS